MRADEIPIPCMPSQMEISLDGSLETLSNDKINEEQNHQTIKEENKEFFDAQEEKEPNKTKESKLSKTQKKRQARKLHQVLMRLKN